MSASMWAELFLVLSKPLLILECMSSVSAVLAPDDHTLTETTLTDDAELVAATVALRDRLLAPPAGDVVSGVLLSDVREGLAASLQDGVRCHFVELEVVKQVDVGHEDAPHEVLGDEGGGFIHEADGGDDCRLQLVLVHQFLQDFQEVDLAHWLHQLLATEDDDAILTDFTLDLQLLLVE
jgi:hypothetical protein